MGSYLAPANAAEFWDQDSGFIFGLVRKLLGPTVSPADAEDAAAEIIERLLVAVNADGQNILGQYDPDKLSQRTGTNVTWRGFLAGKVALYCRGKRESIDRRAKREPLLCDTQSEGGERWVELFGGKVWDDYPSLSDEEFVERIRAYLATVPGDWDGPASLFQVFNEVLERLKHGEHAKQAAGLTVRQTRQALARIRDMLGDAVTAPQRGPIEVAGVKLTPVEARDALDRLKAATGNHVHRALAGHRLMTEGPKGWYHDFAAVTLAAFPECGVESFAGKVGGAGNGHVKAAVIYGLTRLLAGVPDPEPDPEPEPDITRAELLEAELWHISGLNAATIDAILVAAQKVYA